MVLATWQLNFGVDFVDKSFKHEGSRSRSRLQRFGIGSRPVEMGPPSLVPSRLEFASACIKWVIAVHASTLALVQCILLTICLSTQPDAPSLIPQTLSGGVYFVARWLLSQFLLPTRERGTNVLMYRGRSVDSDSSCRASCDAVDASK